MTFTHAIRHQQVKGAVLPRSFLRTLAARMRRTHAHTSLTSTAPRSPRRSVSLPAPCLERLTRASAVFAGSLEEGCQFSGPQANSDRASTWTSDRGINMHTHHTRTRGLADQAITTDPRPHTPVVLLTLTLDSALEHGRPHAIVQPQAHARYTQRVPTRHAPAARSRHGISPHASTPVLGAGSARGVIPSRGRPEAR